MCKLHLYYFLSLLRSYTARGTKLKKINVAVLMNKVIPRGVRLIWSAEKRKVEQTIVKFG